MKYELLISLLIILLLLSACEDATDPLIYLTREETIPEDAIKMTPATDLYPPVLHSAEWELPVPMPGPVNTAGAEDAPVISRDGSRFLFFFTPDVDVPPENQIIDNVSGIWSCEFSERSWTEPQRVILNDDIALDGPMCVQADTLWFATFREDNLGDDGDIWKAYFENGIWSNWENAGSQLNLDYNIGELYTDSTGSILIFHREGSNGYGGIDLWEIEKSGQSWSEPVNLGPEINTSENEGWPWLSAAGNELWFTAWSGLGYQGPALFRCTRTENGWSEAEEIISSFAGDPALDSSGNIYFTHHYFDEELDMIEADIYVAYKR